MKPTRYHIPLSADPGWIDEGDEEEIASMMRHAFDSELLEFGQFIEVGENRFDEGKIHTNQFAGVELQMGKNGALTGAIISLYGRAGDGEKDRKRAIQWVEASFEAGEGLYGEFNHPVRVTGPMEEIGPSPVPKNLYHITEKKWLNDILERGLKASCGRNSWRVHEDQVFLTDLEDLPAWMCSLQLEDAAIVEVEAANCDFIRPGRHFVDRLDIAPEGYGEYVSSRNLDMGIVHALKPDEAIVERLRTPMEKCGSAPEIKMLEAILNKGSEDDFADAVREISEQDDGMKQ